MAALAAGYFTVPAWARAARAVFRGLQIAELLLEPVDRSDGIGRH
jgi:hypothetical protein